MRGPFSSLWAATTVGGSRLLGGLRAALIFLGALSRREADKSSWTGFMCDWAVSKGGQSRTVPETTLSDHSPTILEVDALVQSLVPRSCKIPACIDAQVDVCTMIEVFMG